MLVEIARALPRCQFVFFSHAHGEVSQRLRLRLEGRFREAGLDMGQNCVFIPWQSKAVFHGLMRRSAVFLDTIGFSGFNTALQAVECGLPVVTREGKFLRGRLASGILRTMGLPELIAASDADYVALAVRLAGDLEFREHMRARLAGQLAASSNLLFNDVETVRGLENNLVAALRQN